MIKILDAHHPPFDKENAIEQESIFKDTINKMNAVENILKTNGVDIEALNNERRGIASSK